MPNLPLRTFVGYNNRISPFLIPDDTLTRAFNIVLDDFGNPQKMNGFSEFNSTAVSGTGEFLGLFRVYEGIGTVAGTSKQMIAKTDVPGLVSFTDAGVSSAITVSGTALDSTRCQFATYNDTTIITNGDNAVKVYTIGGSATDLGGSPPTSQFVTVHRERVWLAGNSTNPSQVSFSEIFTPTTWRAADFLEIGLDDGDQITGIASVPAGLLVWKNHSMWLVQGNSISTFSKIKLSDNIGCVAPHSIAEVDGRWYFLSRDGVYSTTGGPPVLESFPIQGDIDDIRTAALSSVFGFGHLNKWYVMSFQSSAQTDTQNLRQVVLDTNLRELNAPGVGKSGWVYWDNQPINVATNWDAGNDVGETYFGASNSGFVRRLDNGTTRAGANFNYDIQTKFFGDEIEKLWDIAYLDVESSQTQTINLSYITSQPTNSGTFPISASFTGDIWGAFDWGTGRWGGSVTNEFKAPFRGDAVGRFVQIRIMSEINAFTSTIRGLNLTFQQIPAFV